MHGTPHPPSEPISIAFLTPEYVTDYRDGGGLGTYLHRMAQALLVAGHRVEVFVGSRYPEGVFEHEGVLVHRVWAASRRKPVRAVCRLLRGIPSTPLRKTLWLGCQALALAETLEARSREVKFDVVQSADYMAAGLFVAKKPGRAHLVRCSSASDLYATVDGERSLERRIAMKLEFAAIRRADQAYAPSSYVARHLSQVCRRRVHVLRPPIGSIVPATCVAAELPDRYFVHFGQLRKRKGTEVLAEALPLVWKAAPQFQMVWAGTANDADVERWRGLWGTRSTQVLVLPPMARDELYAVVQRADAAVLPSLEDNLPNTVIEALSLGVPVIGSAGASIDELITPGVTGELAALDDPRALADVILRLWQGESPVCRGFTWDDELRHAMQPEIAVQRMLDLAGA